MDEYLVIRKHDKDVVIGKNIIYELSSSVIMKDFYSVLLKYYC